MKKNKGFTLVELLAIFIVMGIIALIIVPGVSKIRKKSQEKTFIESVKGVLTSVNLMYNQNKLGEVPVEGIDILDDRIQIKNKSTYKKGKVKFDEVAGKFILEDITNGAYCGNGSIDNLTVKPGNCD